MRNLLENRILDYVVFINGDLIAGYKWKPMGFDYWWKSLRVPNN